jgi:hypothetical protein
MGVRTAASYTVPAASRMLSRDMRRVVMGHPGGRIAIGPRAGRRWECDAPGVL